MRSYIVSLVVLALLAGSAFAAGGMIANPPPSAFLGDNIVLPGLQCGWWTSNREDRTEASVYLNLEHHRVQNAGWSFYVREYDPSQWWASFSASGFLLDEEEASVYVSREQEGRVERGSLTLTVNTNMGMNTIGEGDMFHAYQGIHGRFSLTPATINSAQFDYNEYQDPFDPLRTQWHGNFYIQGNFLADTLKEAQALGAQFVPEPATICLLGLGTAGILFRRRHRR